MSTIRQRLAVARNEEIEGDHYPPLGDPTVAEMREALEELRQLDWATDPRVQQHPTLPGRFVVIRDLVFTHP